MCGIALVVETVTSCRVHDDSKFQDELQRRLCQRGPDHFQRLNRSITNEKNTEDDSWSISMCSAVLHLRGDELVAQPVVDASDNVLCWNGEIFGMGVNRSSAQEEDEEILLLKSDTTYLSKKLHSAGILLDEMTEKQREELGDPVVEVLRRVRGPFAVAWLHAKTKKVYFAHDRFGRRSLLYKCGGDGLDVVDQLAAKADTEVNWMSFSQSDLPRFVLASVGVGDNAESALSYQELPVTGIFVMDLQARPSYRLEIHPYTALDPMLPVSLPFLPASQAPAHILDRFGNKLPQPVIPVADSSELEGPNTLESSASALLIALSDAVGVRVRSIPPRPSSDEIIPASRVAVLFSGGLDSVVLAALTHFHVPVAEPVDLLTVCFDESSTFASPDRLAAELAHTELCTLFPERQWRLVLVNVPRTELANEQREVQALMAPCDTHMDFNIGTAFWFLSRGRGEPKVSAQAADNTTLEELNAFLKPRRTDLRTLEADIAALALFANLTLSESASLCPVRRCGRKRKHGCVLGVCKSCCFKVQRALDNLIPFVKKLGAQQANLREMSAYQAKLLDMGIQSEAHLNLLLDLLWSRKQDDHNELVEPPFLRCRVHRSKVDQAAEMTLRISISTAASTSSKTSGSNQYQTPARVVLVGIGADEQLAGYGRHCTALLNGGEATLRAELRKDLDRIWKRNLGRDDRCIAAHGREARFPYLDEHVVSTIASFPVSSLCEAELPRGVGDKRALRVVAKTLGLRSCAGLAKRAIQFGTRIAKVSNTGSNRQTQGSNKFASVE